MTTRYRSHDPQPDDGGLAVGEWAGSGPLVLALHGLTAHHRCWDLVAQALPDHRVLAPDLRGRGRSNALSGASSMAQHADDVARVLREREAGPAVVVGHSMGGFVALVLAVRHPDLVDRLVLVDGGLPFAPAELTSTRAALEAIQARLEARWPDEEAYVNVFRQHPALVSDWSEATHRYVTYDAERTPDGSVRASARTEAVLADQVDILEGSALAGAWESLEAGVHPASFLHAPRGFVDDPPGLYADATVRDLQQRFPHVAVQLVPDVNHYTVVLSERGAAAVAGAVLTPT